MAFLEHFSDDERSLIVSLPYRVGIWVSVADDAGGRKAAQREMEALAVVIKATMPGMFRSAFVHEVMAEIIMLSDKWLAWAEQTDDVLEDCRQVMDILTEKLAARDADAYRENLMLIGAGVAASFREFDLKKKPAKGGLLSMVTALAGRRDETASPGWLGNISVEEDAALSRLLAALRIVSDGKPKSAAS